MVTVFLNGGLGNQLFQVAATYAHAMEHNDVCAFDFSVIPKNQGNSPMSYINTLYRGLRELPKGWTPKNIYKEPRHDYDTIPYRKDTILKGYFGRERYFIRYRDEIIRLFRNEDIIEELKDTFKFVLNNSVSMHVRRGDYLRFSNVYNILTHEYYYNALKLIEKTQIVDNILVFSDDIEWCKSNMPDCRITFIEGQSDDYDLLLMGLCNRGNIIANSTFSQWGATLGEEPLKPIIAPKKWFLNEHLNANVVPSRWIRI